ncbi:hypothetical protein KP79_PYT18714 [Mizuhopecten yessoensis]|uniref:Uncharacterized protein n=1 Tax=Mizuhopecten yessoensis TaxID=6573 RepID=A0A210QHX9_MIZYE|nr:hypothetical protein KP79_PYT18714 [Mizuhopecten yessoensis]
MKISVLCTYDLINFIVMISFYRMAPQDEWQGRSSEPPFLPPGPSHEEGRRDRELQMRLVEENLLACHQTTTYKRVQGKIFVLWDRLDSRDPDNRLTTSDFLRKVGNIYAPRE